MSQDPTQIQLINAELECVAHAHNVVVMSLSGCPGLGMALIGTVVLRDLPVILLRRPGVRLPSKVIAIADRFIDIDPMNIDWSLVAAVRTAAEQLSSMEDNAS